MMINDACTPDWLQIVWLAGLVAAWIGAMLCTERVALWIYKRWRKE